MSYVTNLLARFHRDQRGSVQPEVIALTISAMLLGVTYLETQQKQGVQPPIKEEIYVRKCSSAVAEQPNGLQALRNRNFCN